MRPHPDSRRDAMDLLIRAPAGAAAYEAGWWEAMFVDRSAQLHNLVDLLDRGLLSLEEFERHKRVLIGGAHDSVDSSSQG